MKNKPTYIMLGVGILLQVLTFLITKDTLLSFVSGIAGVFSVVYCSERKLSFYFWSFLQIVTFTIICFNEHLYAKIFENVFYLITLGCGLGIWLANRGVDNKVETRYCDKKQVNIFLTLLLICMFILFPTLYHFGGTLPWFDAFTTSLAIVAQIMMILRFQENWIVWFIVDVLCIILFTLTHNWCMVAQYTFWTINTIYGYRIWNNNSDQYKA